MVNKLNTGIPVLHCVEQGDEAHLDSFGCDFVLWMLLKKTSFPGKCKAWFSGVGGRLVGWQNQEQVKAPAPGWTEGKSARE